MKLITLGLVAAIVLVGVSSSKGDFETTTLTFDDLSLQILTNQYAFTGATFSSPLAQPFVISPYAIHPNSLAVSGANSLYVPFTGYLTFMSPTYPGLRGATNFLQFYNVGLAPNVIFDNMSNLIISATDINDIVVGSDTVPYGPGSTGRPTTVTTISCPMESFCIHQVSFGSGENNAPAFIDNLTFGPVATMDALGDSGNFNNDGVIDARDYVLWRENNGTPAQYDAWRANFGLGFSGGGAGVAGSATVPEPSMFALTAASVVSFVVRRRPNSHNRV